jgi:hypothetical protein
MQRFRHPDQFGKRLKVGHRVRFGSQSGQQVFWSRGPGSLFTIRTSRTHFLATTHVGARSAAGRMLDGSVTPSASAISGLVSPPTRSDSKAQGLRTSSKVGLNRVRPISATRRSLGPYFSEPLNFAQKVRIPNACGSSSSARRHLPNFESHSLLINAIGIAESALALVIITGIRAGIAPCLGSMSPTTCRPPRSCTHKSGSPARRVCCFGSSLHSCALQ